MSILDIIEQEFKSLEAKIKCAGAEELEARFANLKSEVNTDWKALALEAHNFLQTVTSRHAGDATFDFAQQFIAKVKARI
jgi:hypothetical protein